MTDGSAGSPGFGALVISLDLELHWGVRDWCSPTSPYLQNLLGARRASEALLSCFEKRGIAATWATVGMLFAQSGEELRRFWPQARPSYVEAGLSPYHEPVGRSEEEDPIHLAASLVGAIRACPGQEIGTQTFSHYYCMEPGQTLEEFRADMTSALRIAAARGVRLESIVFPRNQANPAYLPYLQEFGIMNYRGDQRGPLYRSGPWGPDRSKVLRRALRLADAYGRIADRGSVRWSELSDGSGLCNIAASRFLRPYAPRLRAAEGLRLQRILNEIDQSARDFEIFHLWWHPHNFGSYLEENMAFLGQILDRFEVNRRRYGMRSMTMGEVGQTLRSLITAP